MQDLLVYEQPKNYIVNNTNYNKDYKIPVLTAGKSFILGYTNEQNGIFSDLPIIIFDDFITSSQYIDFSFKIKSSTIKILKNKDTKKSNIKYIYYAMQQIKFDHSTHKRYWISEFQNIKISLPPLSIQEEIILEIEEIENVIKQHEETIKKYKEKKDLIVSKLWE